jgi:hypothetical protein
MAPWIAIPVPATALVAQPAAPQQALSGKGHGSASFDAVQSGAGIDYHLHGSAQFSQLGKFHIRGSVHAVGFIAHGQAGGTLTFSNEHGSITVALEGPTQAGFSPLPHHFKYHIVKGTGDYAHLSGHGTLTLVLQPTTNAQHDTFKLSV